jgi:hypothetical protein
MKRIIQTIILASFPFTHYAQSPECQNFRIGKFQNIDKDGPGTLIKRTEKYQFEKNKTKGTKIKLQINWIDECTYRLKLIKGNRQWNKLDHVPNSPDLIVKITETGSDYYKQVSVFEGLEDLEYESRLKILK